MLEIGRLCVKLAGRDAGKKCLIIDIIDDRFVMVDGETRRKKCNVLHLEPSETKVELAKNAEHSVVMAEFKKLGIELKEKKSKERKERPKKVIKHTLKEKKPKKAKKKVAPKVEKEKETKKVEKKTEEKPSVETKKE